MREVERVGEGDESLGLVPTGLGTQRFTRDGDALCPVIASDGGAFPVGLKLVRSGRVGAFDRTL